MTSTHIHLEFDLYIMTSSDYLNLVYFFYMVDFILLYIIQVFIHGYYFYYKYLFIYQYILYNGNRSFISKLYDNEIDSF